jgi:hypothetical protein
MACLDPGKSVEATCFAMPVRLGEAAIALEGLVPRLVNSSAEAGTCGAVVAITDRFESCVYEQTYVESVPGPDTPIMGIHGADTTEAIFDSWLAKGTLLGADGSYSVFVAFMDVMRRPLQGSWTVMTLTVMGTKQSVRSFLEEIAEDLAYV